MQIDIKGVKVTPLRQTYAHVARRLGKDEPASRYLEATLDMQSSTNFHYRPLWDPDHEVYDARRTVIAMQDWYAFLDPRQYYYGTWTMMRAKQQDAAESQFAFVEKRGLLDRMTAEHRRKIETVLLPVRHLEYAANLNNSYITAYGFGAALTQAAMMCASDRLGMAQYLTRFGLLLDGNSGDALRAGKASWQNDAHWQPLRELIENMLVTRDWFELLLAQDFVLDGCMFPLIYQHFDQALVDQGEAAFAMLTGFMVGWYEEHVRWIDRMLKIATGESQANAATLQGWYAKWQPAVAAAIEPLARHALGDRAGETCSAIIRSLDERAAKCGVKA